MLCSPVVRDTRARRDGRNVHYRLQDDHVLDLIRAALEHAREEKDPRSVLRASFLVHDAPPADPKCL